jgi:hypothetical protein
MKKLGYLIVVLFLCYSCKDETVEPPFDLSNKIYIGKGSYSGLLLGNIQLHFQSDGTCKVFTQSSVPSLGNWSKTPSSNDVFIYYTEPNKKWSGKATLNADNTKLEKGKLIDSNGSKPFEFELSLKK